MDDNRTLAPPPAEQADNVIPLRGHWLDPDELVPVAQVPRLTAEQDDPPLIGADGIWDDNPAAHEVCDALPSPEPRAVSVEHSGAASPALASRRWGAGIVGLAAALIVLLASLNGQGDGSHPSGVAQTHASVPATRPAVLNASHATPQPRRHKHPRRAGPRKVRSKARHTRAIPHRPVRHVNPAPAPTPRPAPVAVSQASAQPTVTSPPVTLAPRPTATYVPVKAAAPHPSSPRPAYPEFGP